MTEIGDATEAGLKSRMKRWLGERGVTLKELAERTGDEYKNVQRWVSGRTTVPAAFVARFVAHTDVDPRWLLLGIEEEKGGEELPEGAYQPIGDRERLRLAAELAALQRALLEGDGQ